MVFILPQTEFLSTSFLDLMRSTKSFRVSSPDAPKIEPAKSWLSPSPWLHILPYSNLHWLWGTPWCGLSRIRSSSPQWTAFQSARNTSFRRHVCWIRTLWNPEFCTPTSYFIFTADRALATPERLHFEETAWAILVAFRAKFRAREVASDLLQDGISRNNVGTNCSKLFRGCALPRVDFGRAYAL